jgi:23S rRNA-intervening sequence protein
LKRLPTKKAEDSSSALPALLGANYIEANEAPSKKDFVMRIKICRKEAKESRYWLRLIDTRDQKDLETERESLVNEATELMNIFGAILQKSKKIGRLGHSFIRILNLFRISCFEFRILTLPAEEIIRI